MAFRTNQPTRLDERMFSMCQMKSLPLNSLIQYMYPDLYPIHTLEEQVTPVIKHIVFYVSTDLENLYFNFC